jgi:hypothetical protein
MRAVITPNGEVLKMHSGISRDEGKFIYNLIQSDPRISHTLEVGCAYGPSSLNICAALRGRNGANALQKRTEDLRPWNWYADF